MVYFKLIGWLVLNLKIIFTTKTTTVPTSPTQASGLKLENPNWLAIIVSKAKALNQKVVLFKKDFVSVLIVVLKLNFGFDLILSISTFLKIIKSSMT